MGEHEFRVLIVDDNLVDREAARRLLSDSCIEPEATTGLEGLRLCAEHTPDCVLLDYHLPDGTAATLAPQFLEQGVGVVVLTGRSDQEAVLACLRSGAHDYLTKETLARDPLRRAVRHAVRQASLQRRLRLDERLIDFMPIGAAVFRVAQGAGVHDAECVTVNPAAAACWALAPEELPSLAEVLRADSLDLAFAKIRSALGRQCAVELPNVLSTATGAHREFKCQVVGLESDLFALYFDDVTEHRATENRLRASQRLEAVGRISAGVAHDFNNLLTVIGTCASYLRTDAELDTAALEDVGAILEAVDRAARLTNQLLTFSRLRAQSLRVVNLNRVIDEIAPMLERALGVNIPLSVRQDAHLGNARADLTQLDQVLMNLTINARDSMPHGGSLIIETANVGFKEPHALAQDLAVEPGRYVRLTVSDTGHGMDAETRAHCFEPFFTTKPRHKGTGLGLATVYGIVKQSAGYIWVESGEAGGTAFTIYLPRTDEQEERRAAGVPVQAVGGTETILVVEDDGLVRGTTCRTLRDAGYRVLETASGAEALRVADEHDGVIAAAVTDVVMPGMNGFQLARRLRAARPSIVVLCVSGYPDRGDDADADAEQNERLLAKPFTPAALLAQLRQLIEERAPVPMKADPPTSLGAAAPGK